MSRFTCAAALSLVVLLAGCASPAPPPVLLALPALAGPAAPAAQAAEAAVPPRVLALRRVAIPEYLVARRVRYRADASTLAEWPHTFWAERIEVAVAREFAAALRQRLPGWTVCEAVCADLAPELNLQVELAPLDYLRAARRLDARARVVLATAGAVPQTLDAREFELSVAGADDGAPGQAQAISELLRALARHVAPLVQGSPR
jgi:uncharacterized lipoprotein YmbA